MNIHIHLNDPTPETLKALCEAIKESGLMASVAIAPKAAPSAIGKGPLESEFNAKFGVLRRTKAEIAENVSAEAAAANRLEIIAANPHLGTLAESDPAAFKTELANMVKGASSGDGAGDESIAIGASEPPPEDDGGDTF